MAQAARLRGYDATTIVHEVYRINDRGDFDRVLLGGGGSATWKSRLGRILGGDYVAFAGFLWRYDVFHSFFDGGFLKRTPLRFWEAQLLHLAGKKLIVMPYGSDVAVLTEIKSTEWRDGLRQNYADVERREPAIRRAIDYYTRHADFILGCLIHAETLRRIDLLTTHYYPIDTQAWAPRSTPSVGDGLDGQVVVAHAPNHRGIKGTEYLIAACEQLRRDGLDVELALLEGMPNSVVRETLASADIVAEQFILGYALTAMEGMSLAKPVMSNLEDDRYYDIHRRSTGLSECPIVSVNPESLTEELRRLVRNPSDRIAIGISGRAYVEKFHSLEAMGRLWDAIYRRVWFSEDIQPEDYLPGRAATA